MLGSIINTDGDIEIFFTDEEVLKLKSKTLEGVIFEFSDPVNTNKLYVCIDKNLSNFKISAKRSGKKYCVFIHPQYYEELNKEGWTGTRDGSTKIDLIKESFTKNHEDFARDLRFIKSKYKNS